MSFHYELTARSDLLCVCPSCSTLSLMSTADFQILPNMSDLVGNSLLQLVLERTWKWRVWGDQLQTSFSPSVVISWRCRLLKFFWWILGDLCFLLTDQICFVLIAVLNPAICAILCFGIYIMYSRTCCWLEVILKLKLILMLSPVFAPFVVLQFSLPPALSSSRLRPQFVWRLNFGCSLPVYVASLVLVNVTVCQLPPSSFLPGCLHWSPSCWLSGFSQTDGSGWDGQVRSATGVSAQLRLSAGTQPHSADRIWVMAAGQRGLSLANETHICCVILLQWPPLCCLLTAARTTSWKSCLAAPCCSIEENPNHSCYSFREQSVRDCH